MINWSSKLNQSQGNELKSDIPLRKHFKKLETDWIVGPDQDSLSWMNAFMIILYSYYFTVDTIIKLLLKIGV